MHLNAASTEAYLLHHGVDQQTIDAAKKGGANAIDWNALLQKLGPLFAVLLPLILSLFQKHQPTP